MNSKLFAGLACAFALTMAPASAQRPEGLPDGKWHNAVEETDRAHVLGNPDAETVLIEFISYTCGHCASFAVQGDAAMQLGFVAPGKVRVEVRPVIRNAIDLTVTMLVACGDPAKFKRNHMRFLYSQKDWLPVAVNAPQSQQAIWGRADTAARINMANALGFTDKMESRGYSRPEITACLSDNTVAQQLLDNDKADRAEFPITGTPSFALDGEVLENVHSWQALFPVLSDRVRTVQMEQMDGELPEA